MAEADSGSPTGDFTVLSRDTESRGQGQDQGEGHDLEADAEWARLEEERSEVIEKLCEKLRSDPGSRNRPLRIVFLGKHGSGKSSFINTTGAAFSEEAWHEWAYTGFHGEARAITIFTQRFEKCCNPERYRDIPLPTLIDVAGKMDIGDDKMEELLRLIFYGHIPEDSAVTKAYEFCERHTKDEIRAEYSQAYPEMKIDRVVFVASAADKLPEKLIDCAVRAARPLHYTDVKRSIPVYGILTKMDKVDRESTDFLEKRETFMRGLGLTSTRLLTCTNYCDDIDPLGQRTRRLDPRIDLPVVEFFHQLCDSAQRVIQDDETLPGVGPQSAADKKKANQNRAQPQGEQLLQPVMTFWHGLDHTGQALVAGLAMFVAMWLVLYIVMVLPTGGGPEAVFREACNSGNVQDPKMLEACKIPPGVSPVWRATVVAITAGIGCLLFMLLGRRPE